MKGKNIVIPSDFYYNSHEPCWELKFVGDRFKDLLETDVVAVFKMLKAAYDTLEEWSNREVME